MNPLNVVLIIVVAAAYPVGMGIARKVSFDKVTRLLAAGSYDEALGYLEGRGVRYLFTPYNVGMMRFNTCQMKGDARAAGRELDALLQMRVSKPQRADVVERAFRFYLEEGKRGRARKMLDEVHETCSEATARRCQRMWEIFAEGSSAYIDEMSAAYEKASGPERAQLALLVANQYANRHNARRANEWKAKALA